MKPITKPICIIALISFCVFSNTQALFSKNPVLPDSTSKTSKQREVLLSQQLFTVKISKPKSKKVKPGTVDFKAELCDAFTIICYDNDKSITELDWSMCPDGKCPVAGTFDFGSPQYKYLDTLIANTRLANAKAINKLKRLASPAKNKVH